MKSYRLIKEYPGSPKLGSIAIRYEDNISPKHYITFREDKKICLFTKQIENYSEYWEEIIQKGYEILSFKYGNGDSYLYTLRDNGLYSNSGNIKDFYSLEKQLQNVKEVRCVIYQVKRLSDKEIFTIGDNITNTNPINNKVKIYKITKFVDIDSACPIEIHNSKAGYSYISIDSATKAREKLFTTEDKVDIFDKDNYYELAHTSGSTRLNMVRGPYVALGDGDEDYDSDTKRFSTKQKAQEYLDLNNPKYSKQDVINAINRVYLSINSTTDEYLKQIILNGLTK